MNSIKQFSQKTISVALIFCMISPSYAALGLLNVPPQSVTPPVPNVIVTLDDSGSMEAQTTYESSITYLIPPNADGLPRGNAGGQPRAYNNGYQDPQSPTGNLSLAGNGTFDALPVSERQNYANWYSYYRTRQLTMKGAVSRAFAPQIIPDGRFRLAWQTLGTGGGKCGGFSTGICSVNNRLSSLEAGHRTNFFQWVRGVPANTYTPLRVAYTRVGEYLKTTGLNGAYAHAPGVTETPVLSCRRSYHVLATDGGWNDDGEVASNNSDNQAGVTLPDGNTYAATAPYRGAAGSAGQDSLADIAFTYWITDLQPALTNNVSPVIKKSGSELYGTVVLNSYWNPKNNPSTWQNLTLYAIGFGEAGDLTPASVGRPASQVPTFTTDTTSGASFAEIVSSTRQWPTKNDFDIRAFDLWHAAINSRGSMFSAKRPDEIVNAFQKIVSEILASNAPTGGGASSLGFTSDFVAVKSGYEGAPTWRGLLQGFGQTASVINEASPLFDAGVVMTAQTPNDRVILTASGAATGVPFRWANLSAYEKDMLDRRPGNVVDNLGNLRTDYLRGSRANETIAPNPIPVPEFRGRDNSILGTIVNSEPRVIGRPRSGFVEGSYKVFRDFHINRQKVIYVGANDGMLHGFNGSTGASMLSYVPRGVYARLSDYSDPTYVHKYFVDGPIIPGDAFVDGVWKTFLIGGLGAGGKGFYGLDITDPSGFSEGNASNIVKFDYTAPSEVLPAAAATQFASELSLAPKFSDELLSDLGHIMGDSVRDSQVGRSLQISKMKNGRWALITGNGINSVNERPALYIVYLDAAGGFKTGGFQKVVASAAVGGNNGLSAPLPLDTDSDGLIDTIYAGDIKGKLWKFTSDAAGSFSVANGGAPLIDVGKPITSSPIAAVHPRGGVFISFGSGRLVTVPDKTSTSVESIYGVWDKPGATAGTIPLTSLVARTLSAPTASVDGPLVRTLTSPKVDYSAKRGWYMDLSVAGERVVYNPILNGNLAYYSIIVPIEGTSCSAGGMSNTLLGINIITGAAPLVPAFDVNNDGVFNQSDRAAGGASAVNTVAGLSVGIGKLAGVISSGRGGGGQNCRLLGASGNRTVGCLEGPGRLLWRDLTP
jgi:type IV pilus assembly protein PilY1